MDGVQITGPKISFTIPIFGGIVFTETTIIQWIVMGILIITILFLTHNMKVKNPGKKQILAEMLVNTFNKLVKQNMGEKAIGFAPFICALFVFILSTSLISLTGLRSATADINVTMAFALLTFALITYNKLKYKGFVGYLKSYAEPFALLAPINIISEVATPVSLGFRLFGNMAAGMIISAMVYYGLGTVASLFVPNDIPIFSVGIPAVLSLYFDLFSGFIQAFVFTMLTMVYVGNEISD